jgi:hypothetical protein
VFGESYRKTLINLISSAEVEGKEISDWAMGKHNVP